MSNAFVVGSLFGLLVAVVVAMIDVAFAGKAIVTGSLLGCRWLR